MSMNMSVLDDSQKFTVENLIEEFEKITTDAEKVQTEILKKILQQNGETEYLQKFGLNRRTDPISFKECVPISTIGDYEEYIQRILKGDSSPLILGKSPTRFALSSGTSKGKSKYLAFTDEMMNSIFDILYTSFAYRNRDFPIDEGKTLQFIYGKKTFPTFGGIQISNASAFFLSSPQYQTYTNVTKTHLCSPREVFYCPDFQQALYCHLLSGLIFRDEIQYVYAQFSHNLIRAFRTFEQVWEEMCDIIRTGILPDKITDVSVRESMLNILKPNPEVADLIHKECTGLSDWKGLIPTLFPNIKYVHGIMTGSMAPYLEKLRHYAGNVPLISADYGASEGGVAANVNPKAAPEDTTYVVHPYTAYYEFIPRNDTREIKDPVGLTEVKVGEEYEVVMTTFTGMYRYELGDLVKVVGFHNKTPELQFLCRSNLLLNINIDKNTENDLQVAVGGAAKLLASEKLQLIDFSSMPDLSKEPGHYVIFWELSDEASDDLLRECCDALDQNFVEGGYVASRKTKNIEPLELRVVRLGTFRKILEHSVSSGTSINQYKTPRCVAPSNKKLLEILSEGVVKCFFSMAYN